MKYKAKPLTSESSFIDLQRAYEAVDETHSERIKKIPALQNEIQMLLDQIVDLKQAEENYLVQLGISIPSPINPDGTASYNPEATLPQFSRSNRSSASFRLDNIVFARDTELKEKDGLAFNNPEVSVAMDDALHKLRNEDRTLRLYFHKIMSLKLLIDVKKEELRILNKERSQVEEGEGFSNG